MQRKGDRADEALEATYPRIYHIGEGQLERAAEEMSQQDSHAESNERTEREPNQLHAECPVVIKQTGKEPEHQAQPGKNSQKRPATANKVMVERLHSPTVRIPGIAAKILDGLANRGNRCTRFHRLTEADRHRVGNLLGNLGQEAAAGAAEDAAPDTVEVHRDDGSISALDDALETALEGLQLAGAGDLAFPENTDEVTIVDMLPRIPHGLEDNPRATGGGNLDGLEGPEKGAVDGMMEIGRFDDEANRAVDAGDQEETIDERYMVWNQQGATLRRHVRPSDDSKPVEGAGEENEQKANEGVRDLEQGPHRRSGGQQPGSDEKPVDTDLECFGVVDSEPPVGD